MIKMNNGDFTELQMDFIKELANIGGGNGATCISQLINKPVKMTVPTIDILNYNQVYESIMPEDEIVNAVTMRISGDTEGIFLFVSNEYASDRLVDMMVPSGINLTKEIRESALKELVNIVVSSFLNTIYKIMKMHLMSSVPILTMDMFGAILSSVYIESGQYDENIMIIKNEFHYEGDKIESSLYFVPKPGALLRLFKIIGI